MTEKRKQELRQLLEEAIACLEIQPHLGNTRQLPTIDVDRYKWHLQQSWASYSEDSLWIVAHYRTDIGGNTKSKLLEFMMEELGSFIHEDKILSATFFVLGGYSNGVHLERFLEQLLKIAIVRGIEVAVSAFDRSSCPKGTHGLFQHIALLEGIRIETEIQVFEGIRLVPLPSSKSELPSHLESIPRPNAPNYFFEKTTLVIDYSIFPIFHNPSLPVATTGNERFFNQRDRFHVEINGGKFPSFNEWDFYIKYCQALSLACNSPVKIAMCWEFIAEDELFNECHGSTSHSSSHPGPFGDSTQVGQSQIDEAKRLYQILVNPNSNVAKKLQIPINRWIESKANKDSEDKIIDLGIAFESLYLPKDAIDQLSFQFRLRASWYLGKSKADREKLIDEFKAIYTLRSKAVHNGNVPEKIKIRKGEEPIDTSELILRAQDLCRQSILKILEAGEFPDWNNLILG